MGVTDRRRITRSKGDRGSASSNELGQCVFTDGDGAAGSTCSHTELRQTLVNKIGSLHGNKKLTTDGFDRRLGREDPK